MKNRTIKNLAEQKGRVYVYLANEETEEKFTNQAAAEGFTFKDGKSPADSERGYETVMAVNHDRTLNYVGTNGRIAFGGGFRKIGDEKLIRVDFEKYIAGDEDYYFKDKH